MSIPCILLFINVQLTKVSQLLIIYTTINYIFIKEIYYSGLIK